VIWDIDPLEDCLANAYLELGHLDEASGNMSASCDLTPTIAGPLPPGQAYERKGCAIRRELNTRASCKSGKTPTRKFLKC